MPLLQRLQNFLSGPAEDPATAALYDACVAQARQSVFYAAWGVPDNIDGRFDMLLLHVFLVMRRLGPEREAKQRLFDRMFTDMDRSLREMGVGDMSVGKKMKPMIMAFYGRAQAYEQALGDDDAALAAALERNLYGGKGTAENAAALAAYVRRTVATLAQQQLDDIVSGRIEFTAP